MNLPTHSYGYRCRFIRDLFEVFYYTWFVKYSVLEKKRVWGGLERLFYWRVQKLLRHAENLGPVFYAFMMVHLFVRSLDDAHLLYMVWWNGVARLKVSRILPVSHS